MKPKDQFLRRAHMDGAVQAVSEALRTVLMPLDPSRHERQRFRMFAQQVVSLEHQMACLTDAEFREAAMGLRERARAHISAAGRSHGGSGASNDDLPDGIVRDCIALTREAGRRTTGQQASVRQLMGATALISGHVAEMKTGEGKTLAGTMALAVSAIRDEGVHLITANDYLAKRDAGSMGAIYDRLTLTAGVIVGPSEDSPDNHQAYVYDPTYRGSPSVDPRLQHLRPASRADAYRCDITYGTASQFGFDYLRDNLVREPEQRVQRGLKHALVDEADSVLIDEARTPLIISEAPDASPNPKIMQSADVVGRLTAGKHYHVDLESRAVTLTAAGERKLAKFGLENLYGGVSDDFQYIEQALRAKELYHEDHDYILQSGSDRTGGKEVVIVDSQKGRTQRGQRWSDGLHEAIEAKEALRTQNATDSVDKVAVKSTGNTVASITLQSYFRLYGHLSGMTGTAMSAAPELWEIYGLATTETPEYSSVRKDRATKMYASKPQKMEAIIREIRNEHGAGRPVLVGTLTVKDCETLHDRLTELGIEHNVLNAKRPEAESAVIAQAGRSGAVTVATDMAGRGTDIVLGGDEKFLVAEALTASGLADKGARAALRARIRAKVRKDYEDVTALGGLHIIGTELHSDLRIDNQLRGRAGRQGEPGSTRFFVSLDDELFKKVQGGADRLRTAAGVPRPDGLITAPGFEQRVTEIQRVVQGREFDARKRTFELDVVDGEQRKQVYRQRDRLLNGSADTRENLFAFLREVITDAVDGAYPKSAIDLLDTELLLYELSLRVPLIMQPGDPNNTGWMFPPGTFTTDKARLIDLLCARSEVAYEQALPTFGEDEEWRPWERRVMLKTIDEGWMENLARLTSLREPMELQAFAQKNPRVEYLIEAAKLYEEMVAGVKKSIVHDLFDVIAQRELGGPPDQQVELQESAGWQVE